MSATPTLGAYLIVRNEEAMIDGCLESLRGLDEVVVSDTGSTDATWERLGAWKDRDEWPRFERIPDRWLDDFAMARNEALRYCRADWLIVIDADERLAPGTIEAARAAIATASPAVRTLRWECVADGAPLQVHHMVRLHRRVPDVTWRGAIHETLTDDSGIVAPGCRLIYGHSPAHALDPDRALRILSRESVRDPGDPRTWYYLGREWIYRQQWAEAERYFARRCELVGHLPELADAWLYLARCRWQLGRGDEARSACANALLINADFREALEFLAEMSWPHNAARWRAYAALATSEGVLFRRC